MGAYEYNFVTHCVNDATTLQTALTEAQSNQSDNIILVVQGTYTGNFIYSSAEGFYVSLYGGYTAGCASRVANSANTILDGNNTDGVLFINNGNGGNIEIDGFTIQNGNTSTAGGGIYASTSTVSDTAGSIVITHNVIKQNHAPSNDGGGVYAYTFASSSGTAGDIFFLNDIITGNMAQYCGGVCANSYSNSGKSGTLYFINNIIAGNSVTNNYGGVSAGVASNTGAAGTVKFFNNTISNNTATTGGGVFFNAGTGGLVYCYNNIIRGNTGLIKDIFLNTGGYYYAYNNDFEGVHGTWNTDSGNINEDPEFDGSGDYHLLASSPCIDTGDSLLVGLPSTDFEGDARIIGANVDMGADEYNGLIAPVNETTCAACSLINKYQPPFKWSAAGTFKSFTILFSSSPTFSTAKGVFNTKVNVKGTLSSYTPSLGTWQKILTASYNKGSIQDIYWKATGIKADKSPWQSGVWHFRVDDPQAVVIQTPSDGAPLPSATAPSFTFYTNCNTKFTLEISTDQNFTNTKLIKKFNYSVKDPNLTPLFSKALSSSQWSSVVKLVGTTGTKGYFEIIATDGLKRVTTSEVREFTITP